MTYHRNECHLCGSFDHLTVECIRYEEHDTVAEAAVVRAPYVQSEAYRAWLMGLPSVEELTAPHPLSRRRAA